MGWELFGRGAYRQGDWKITWIERPFGRSQFELFDIVRDPGEARDLRERHPEIFRQLERGWQQYIATNGVIVARPESWRYAAP
jgi:arylsulfatase